jgi:hypothetical protein
VDFVRAWADKTEIAVSRFLTWIGIGTSRFHDWKARFGKVNEHNAWVPRDHWLTDAEKEGIRNFARLSVAKVLEVNSAIPEQDRWGWQEKSPRRT